MKLYKLNKMGDVEEAIFTSYPTGTTVLIGLNKTPTEKIAYIEALSVVVDRFKKEGWVEHPSGVPTLECPKPMLAKIFEKESHKLTYPAIIQPKFDGFRCLAQKKNEGSVICWSRTGNIFETTKEIERELLQLMTVGEVWDGELYRHGVAFNEISGSIRNVKENASVAQYWVYDIVNEQSQGHRIRDLVSKIDNINVTKHIRFAISIIVHNQEQVYKWADIFIDQGYEGAIVRSFDGRYRQDYRSSDLLKVKRWQDAEFKIVAYAEGIGKEEGLVIWICETLEGKTFRTRPRGTYEERKNLLYLAPSYIGKMLTVRFFELSKDGIPRFPVGLRIKEEV